MFRLYLYGNNELYRKLVMLLYRHIGNYFHYITAVLGLFWNSRS